MKRIAIIGAGISSLACALQLEKYKFVITIFEKNRRSGGRVSSRDYDEYHFDYGAQYITMTESPFRLQLEEWRKKGIIANWEAKLGELQGNRFNQTLDNSTILVGTPSMEAIGDYLTTKLDYVTFKYRTNIVEVFKKFNEWYLTDDGGVIHGGFDFIIVTLPKNQAVTLLRDFDYLVEILKEVVISPRWAVMIGFTNRVDTEYDAVFVSKTRDNSEEDSPIRWMARNNSKPNRPNKEAWIVHASRLWSLKHLDKDPDWVADAICQEFLKVSGLEEIETEFCYAYRWKYAIVDKTLNQNYILDNNRNIALVGDYCMGNNIEVAYLSGEALGKRMSQLKI